MDSRLTPMGSFSLPSASMKRNSWPSDRRPTGISSENWRESLPSPPSTPKSPSQEGSRSPPRRDILSESTWRRNSLPPSLPSKFVRCRKDSKPEFDDLRVGQVLRLPVKNQISPSSIFFRGMASRNDEPFDHPVVIVDKNEGDVVSFRTLTSFGGKHLSSKKTEQEQQSIVLCENDAGVKAHLDTCVLSVESGSEKFVKATYINFYDNARGGGVFKIEHDQLQSWDTYNGLPITFDEKSVVRIRTEQVR